jgi:hypothetical protein
MPYHEPDNLWPPEAPCEFTLPPTRERIVWLMDVMGWGASELARRLNCRKDTVEKWRSGKSIMPDRCAIWLESLASIILALPQPYFWQNTENTGAERHEAALVSTHHAETAFRPARPPRRRVEGPTDFDMEPF